MSDTRSRRQSVTRRHERFIRVAAAASTALATCVLGLVAFAPSALAAPTTYVVNSTADPGTGGCDLTECTLREAIDASNSNAGADTINFSIGTGAVTISPTTNLPLITDQVTVDGSTQPGPGSLKVTIDGTGVASGEGLWLSGGGGSLISNLRIGGFLNDQILIQNSSSNSIAGNLLGTEDGVSATSGGNFATVRVQAGDSTQVSNNTVGGGQIGVYVQSSDQVAILGNNIGIGSGGADIGTGSAGILVDAMSQGANIRSNDIGNSGGLGIDLAGDGVTANDASDGDTGANNLQNFPVISNIQQTTTTTIQGSLNSVANETFHLDFFASQACDPSGNGEGELSLGSTDVTTVGNNGSFSINVANPPVGYDYFTATATHDWAGPPGNETSEFSACHTVDAPALTPPDPPTGASAGAGDGLAQISWNTPDSDGGDAITQYTVTSNPPSPNSPMTVSAPTTTATMTGLTNGTNYTFTVSATNGIGTGPNSAPSNQVQPQSGAPAPESTSTDLPPGGGGLTTGSDATSTDPTNTTVQSPNEGIVTIGESTLTGTPPAGVTYFGQQVDIDAPDATATDPMKFTFVFDCSTLPADVSTCPAPFAPLAAPATALAPTTSSVLVSDGSYSPVTTSVRQGGTVTWSFGGTRAHSVTDKVGLAGGGGRLFNSGSRSPGATYSYSFPAAGSYTYRSFAPGDRSTMTGVVSVPDEVSTDTAAPTDPVTVTWATSRPTGFRFDVQYRYRTSTGTYGSWKSWRSNSLTTSSTFTGAGLRGQGGYQFRSHLENMSTGKKSGWSDPLAVTVSATTTGGSGVHIANVAMFHDDLAGNNVQLPDCTGADGVVTGGPACTWSETVNGDGDLVVVVYTTHNNRWRGGKVASG
jgi:CSLREA domain-containing protein